MLTEASCNAESRPERHRRINRGAVHFQVLIIDDYKDHVPNSGHDICTQNISHQRHSSALENVFTAWPDGI